MKAKKHTKLHEWQRKAKEGGVCCCGETRFLTVDHIIPVFVLEQFLVGEGGKQLQYEWEDNFQFLCKWCNQEKRGSFPIRNSRFFALFRELLNKAEGELLSREERT